MYKMPKFPIFESNLIVNIKKINPDNDARVLIDIE